MVTNIDPEEAYPIILYIVVAKVRRILNIENYIMVKKTKNRVYL